jgi:hypothetical protein
MNHTDYYDSIKLHHSFVSFSNANSLFYISLWNGVLRDGRIDDIDIQFFEAKNPIISNGFLSFDNKNIPLSEIQLNYLLLFPDFKN